MSNICFYYEEKRDYISLCFISFLLLSQLVRENLYTREVKSGKSQGILFSIFCGNPVCKTFGTYRSNKDVKVRPKSLSNPLDQMSSISINYKNIGICYE